MSHRSISLALAGILVLAGLVLGFGGIWLLMTGGSVFYLVQGVAFIATGVLLWSRSPLTLWAYALLLLLTLAWALTEVGLDWWQLMPRGDFAVALGIVLVLPWIARAVPLRQTDPIFRSGWIALVGCLVVSIAVALLAFFTPTNDLAGNLPARSGTDSVTLGSAAGKEWTAYGGTQAGQRYSTLNQITPQNVEKLQVAWTFHTGDIRSDKDPTETTYEVTPLKIGQTIYLCTPHDLVFALDAETGQEKWRYDPKVGSPPYQSTQHLTCRGLSYFDATASGSATPGATASAECAKRLFLPTVDGRLIALSAETGKTCAGFGGPGGTVNLWQNMPNAETGSYYSTSPPIIAKGLIIIGGAVNDNVSTDEPSGVIRAFDINTGKLVWNWDSKKPDETSPIAADAKYSKSSPNSWSIASYDPLLGLVFIPMGNQPPDQFGGKRDKDVETYASSVVALNAETGAVAWVFQSTHHDLWDMDVPAQPGLVDLTIAGVTVPVLVETTKQGELFVLDRRSGKPVLPVTEVTAPQGAVAGDNTAPTQPVSALSFNPKPLTEVAMWGLSPFDQLACRIAFRSMRYEGRYTPPSLKGTIVYPGNFGTFNWGGVAIDPERQVVFAMPVYLAFTSTLIPRPDATSRVVTKPDQPPFNENFGAPYAAKMGPFLSPLGLPCQAPPWGYVAGADLTTGKIFYRHVNGTVRDLSPIPLPLKMGVPGIGGPMLTKGGVAFLSGSLDYYARAYDVTTGKQLWESRLPAGGQATPMTYWSDASERQFVLVVAGGHGSTGTKAGDSILAYALPKP
ncbi:membrane-bound PQQ-dependent dehydrogenase, glucose/quinate/shikimate family [Bradyrhizobium sp. 2]|uniref:membrane-bound PQQ-dependent dehydrogenase, glucose/quinate/shikimate family n=1 Tax=Bradyrhizobium sp. 2 TaxID=190045 RepID=UPI001FFA6B16|nr:membrane-bound PQQ-dependent dehydrogenase, glucose/quinate/shikimate family [Bradyrhizobium sp. 2]MCK1462989.1 membrane-bound PQQ-dependent dehydrogenase, glucose/quinate/shikimate family [Bradyrhizobium sp. 2]